jgi:signal transduction histidine kinase
MKQLKSQLFSQNMVGHLIDDLMDLSKIENCKFKFNNEFFCLYAVIHDVFQMMLSQVVGQGIQLRLEIEDPQQLAVFNNIWGDSQRFLQILANFLSNSIKFTNKNGEIVVVLRLLESQLNTSKVSH